LIELVKSQNTISNLFILFSHRKLTAVFIISSVLMALFVEYTGYIRNDLMMSTSASLFTIICFYIGLNFIALAEEMGGSKENLKGEEELGETVNHKELKKDE
jgi:hypothetical protein